jgi:hypothetical protein
MATESPSFLVDEKLVQDMRSEREFIDRRARTFNEFIARMLTGERLLSLPWNDALFQELIVKALALAGGWKHEAEKLAVIREVFGGK